MIARNEPRLIRPRFLLGRVVATPGAISALEENQQSPSEFLDRHISGDWDDMDSHDCRANQIAIDDGNRIFSAYRLRNGSKIWVITEADRSSTTLLLPDEY